MYTNQLSIDSGEALSYENNDDNDDFNIDIDADEFIGRDEELKNIKAHWKTCKIFGIFGIRSVGKSKLVNEFIKTQNRKRFELLRVDVGLINDPSKLYPNLCALLKQEPDNELLKSDEWMNDIARHLNSIPDKCYVIFFDNTEDCQDLKGPEVRDAFLSFIPTLAKQCKYVKIFITSTTRIQFTLLRKVYFSLELKPLKPVHAGELLRSVISENVDLGEYESTIVKLSEGLPLLLKMIGSELSEDEGMLTPQDIVELLAKCRLKALSKEYYPPEDRVDYVYKKFIDRLEPKFRDYLTTLEFIPGPFLAEQARDMLGYETTALVKNDVLVHHRRRHLLEYDPTQKRFNIQGILRECFQTFYTVKNIAEVRTRYCRVFSTVMTNITKRLGTEEYTKALSEFSVEQPNLEKLLTEVRYTSQDNYKFFIQMATNCTELIERFMASRCDDFYQCCIKASEMYGQVVDKASVNIAVGSLYTNTKGDLVHGEINYSSALPVLEQNGPSLQLATAYQRMGWNMLQQAKNEDAVSYFQKSLAISSISGKEYELIMLQTLSSMGVTLTVLGNFDDAERYHFACLKRRREVQGPNHPSIGSTLNNIGIMYDQKEDHEKALEYYTQGLEIKKKYNAPVISMVFSLTNSANACMMVKKYSQAHSHLNEALERLLGQTVTPREALAHTYDSKGKAFRSEKKYELAADMFEKGLELRKEIATETMPYMESLVHLADANRRLENFDKSRKLCTKALKMKSKAIKAMPQNSFISECLECLSEIYKMKEDNIDRYRDTLIQIEAELLRLESVYVSQGNERGLERIRDKMVNVKDRLQTVKVQKKCEVLYKREL